MPELTLMLAPAKVITGWRGDLRGCLADYRHPRCQRVQPFWRILHLNRSIVHSCVKLRLKYWALFQNVANMSGLFCTV
jgi:hypothetical protein